jgi:hypothetical protein
MFAPAVYLTFSSVYACKETVEHLLNAGNGEGDHGDEEVGLGYVVLYFVHKWLTDNVQDRIPRVPKVHHAHFTYQHCVASIIIRNSLIVRPPFFSRVPNLPPY